MSDCLFCQIVAGQIPSYRLYEDEAAIAFLDIGPWHRGHSLVVPKRHTIDGTVEADSWHELAEALVTVSQLLRSKLGASGINLLSNAGASAGQEVFHFHVHVIPRYDDHPGMAGLSERDPGAADDLAGLHALLMAQ